MLMQLQAPALNLQLIREGNHEEDPALTLFTLRLTDIQCSLASEQELDVRWVISQLASRNVLAHVDGLSLLQNVPASLPCTCCRRLQPFDDQVQSCLESLKI